MFFPHAKTFEECPSGQKESNGISPGESERDYTSPQFEIGSSTSVRCSKNTIGRTGIWVAALPSDPESETSSTENGGKEQVLAPLYIGKVKENKQCIYLDEIENKKDGKDRDLDASGGNSVEGNREDASSDATEYFIDSSTSSEEGSDEGNEWFSCKVCEKVFFARKAFTRHKRSCCLEVEINCPHCSKVFPKRIELKDHVKAAHKNDGRDRDLDASGGNSDASGGNSVEGNREDASSDATEYFIDSSTSSEVGSDEGNEWFSCKVCEKVFFARKAFTRHKRSCCLEVEINCPHCSKVFPKMNELKDHVKAAHKNDRPFLCDICGKTFLELRYLKWHTLTHTKLKEHTCEECGKCFTHHWHLKSHAVIHSDEKPFQCEECGRNFRRSSTLRFHKRTHTNERPHQCDVCGKSFTQPSSLKTHQKLHSGERPHVCNVCNERFSLKSALQSHMRTHTKEKPFSCVLCSKNFAQSSTLKNHLKTHENIKTSETVCSNEDSVGDDEAMTGKKTKKHRCELCGRSFTMKSTLKIHMMRHRGERPHKCDICSKSFTQSSTLKIHMRTHTGDKPYACNVCKSHFTYKYALEKHRLKHKENREGGEEEECSDHEDGDVELIAFGGDCFDTNQSATEVMKPEILRTLSRAKGKNVMEKNNGRVVKHVELIKNTSNSDSGLDKIHLMSSDKNQGKNCKKITPMDFLAVFQSSLKASHD